MGFFLQRAIGAVKLLLLITIGVTAKLTYDLTTTNYGSAAKNKYTYEQKINEEIFHQTGISLGNFEIAEQSKIPARGKSRVRDHDYFDKRQSCPELSTF